MNKTIESIKLLSKYVQKERLVRFDSVIQNRTKTVSIVFENIIDVHNAGACLRSAEGMC